MALTDDMPVWRGAWHQPARRRKKSEHSRASLVDDLHSPENRHGCAFSYVFRAPGQAQPPTGNARRQGAARQGRATLIDMAGPAQTLSPALPNDVEQVAEQLLKACCKRNLKLATAESCTGGLLASLLTDVEGASHAFERGFVVYSEEAKCELLGIARKQIDACGAVSREVAIAMAQGALHGSPADVALAVTGYAGMAPEGGEAGLVPLACARGNGAIEHREMHFGDIGRGPVRIATLRIALKMMMDAIEDD